MLAVSSCLANPYSSMGDSDMHHYKSILVRTSDEIRKYDEQGLLVEVVSARTGEPLRLLLVPELLSSTGQARSAELFGDLLAVRTGRNNTVVYRCTDGARLMAFFGYALAGDTGLGLIAATNRPQELFIYDVATGKERIHVTLDQPALAARFIPSKKQLFVLSASQHVYAIDLPAESSSPAGNRAPTCRCSFRARPAPRRVEIPRQPRWRRPREIPRRDWHLRKQLHQRRTREHHNRNQRPLCLHCRVHTPQHRRCSSTASSVIHAYGAHITPTSKTTSPVLRPLPLFPPRPEVPPRPKGTRSQWADTPATPLPVQHPSENMRSASAQTDLPNTFACIICTYCAHALRSNASTAA